MNRGRSSGFRRVGLAILGCLALGLPTSRPAVAADASEPVTLILVRHADKAAFGGDDPALGAAGLQRARDLAASLKEAGITAIVVSTYRRTRETAQPLAEALGLRPIAVPTNGSLGAHVKALKAAVRGLLPGTVLVVGHANTIPMLMTAFAGPTFPEICDDVYDRMFVLYEAGGRTRTIQSRYGASTPGALPECR